MKQYTSPLLRQFFIDYLHECSLYQQTWMDTTKGLCINIVLWCRTNAVEEQQMLSELYKLLDRTIGVRDYPFCSAKEYIHRMQTGTQHMCHNRLTWVKSML